jgi:hypothetical protein
MTYENLKSEIEQLARFESLVQMPVRSDPDWPRWTARATEHNESFMGKGETDIEALKSLLLSVRAG